MDFLMFWFLYDTNVNVSSFVFFTLNHFSLKTLFGCDFEDEGLCAKSENKQMDKNYDRDLLETLC